MSGGGRRFVEVFDNFKTGSYLYEQVAGSAGNSVAAQSFSIFTGSTCDYVVECVYAVNAGHACKELGSLGADSGDVEFHLLEQLVVEVYVAVCEVAYICSVAVEGDEV